MCSVLLHVEESCRVVTSVLGHVTIATKGVHMNYANIHVVDCSFVHTAVKQHVVSPALPVTENAADVVLMGNAKGSVHNRVNRAKNRVIGVVLIISAIIFVERSAIAQDVMPRVARSFPVATRVLVCVEKTVLLCAPNAILRSFLPC